MNEEGWRYSQEYSTSVTVAHHAIGCLAAQRGKARLVFRDVVRGFRTIHALRFRTRRRLPLLPYRVSVRKPLREQPEKRAATSPFKRRPRKQNITVQL